MSMKRKYWLLFGGLALATALVAGWVHLSRPVCECLSTLTIEEGMNPGRPVHEINATHVRTSLPEFYGLLEEAHHKGTAHTSDHALIWEIRSYIEEVTGSIEPNDNLHYRGKIFRTGYGGQ